MKKYNKRTKYEKGQIKTYVQQKICYKSKKRCPVCNHYLYELIIHEKRFCYYCDYYKTPFTNYF